MQAFSKTNFIIFFILFLTPLNLKALSPEVRLSDEALEERAMKLFLEVRCLVCQGQVIESSDTEFSIQLRKLIRNKIADKKSDDEIKQDLVKEFGEDILLKPSFKNQFLLWLLPLIFIILTALILRKNLLR